MEKTFKAMQCKKCRKYFKKKQESLSTCKKTPAIFGSFRHILLNPKTKTNGQLFK